MGNCFDTNKGSVDEQRINKDITRSMSENYEEEQQTTHRIILLGPGNSGKTTILKQMRKIYLGEIPKNEIEDYKAYIGDKMIQFMQILCEQSTILNETIECIDSHKTITNLETPYSLTIDITNHIKILWKDTGIQNTLKQRAKFQIADNVSYFFNDRLDDIMHQDYIPTFEDYIRIRMRTTGFSQEKFSTWIGTDGHSERINNYRRNSIVSMSSSVSSSGNNTDMDKVDIGKHNGNKKQQGRKHDFIFIDVGGQRSERKKWINMMKENINIVLYIIAISEYDLMCFEDDNTLRLHEALDLFDKVMKAGFMTDKTVTIFFNKHDLLLKKLNDESKLSPKHYFEDFPSDKNDRDENVFCEWVYSKFVDIYKENLPKSNTIPHYLKTSALNTNQIESLMDDIQNDLMTNLLSDAGW